MSFVEDKIDRLRTNAIKKCDDVSTIKGQGIPFGCLDEYSSKVMDLIGNSEAFQNIKSVFVDASKNASAKLKDFLNQIGADNLPEGWSLDDISKLLKELDLFDISMDSFKQWTDHLAGIVPLDGFPNMDSILGMCNSMQKYFSCAGIELPQSKDQAKRAFGSLLLDQATTDYTENYINSIERLMYDGATPDDILNELERNRLIYDTSVYRDKENINDFTKTLINQNTALNITGMNEYETGFNLLTETLASDKLKNLMR